MMHLTGANPDEVWPLVRDHHYSGRLPANIQHCYAMRASGGLFGDFGDVLAAAVFSIPPTRWSEETLELSRLVRHPEMKHPLTRLLGFACAALRKNGHHLLVSFADWTQKHHGGIYQAAGWNYGGLRAGAMDGLIINGTFKPGRSCNSAFGTRSPTKLKEQLPEAQIEPHYDDGKHLYWKPLTIAGKTRAKRLGLKSLPYPKPSRGPSIGRPDPIGASDEHTVGAAP